jgi:hypothetical protein
MNPVLGVFVGMALYYLLNLGTRWGWVVIAMTPAALPPGKDPLPLLQETVQVHTEARTQHTLQPISVIETGQNEKCWCLATLCGARVVLAFGRGSLAVWRLIGTPCIVPMFRVGHVVRFCVYQRRYYVRHPPAYHHVSYRQSSSCQSRWWKE